MTVEPTTILVVSVVFLASLTRSTFGFGDALVGMPLLAMVGELTTAAPLIALTSATVAAAIVLSDWRRVSWKNAVGLVVPAAAGIPLGFLYLTQLDPVVVKSTLAVVVIAFSLYGLWGQNQLSLPNDRSIYAFGFCAGVLGGAYNTHGPPLVVYGSLRGWTAEQFRATLQGYFLPTSLAIIFGHVLAERCTPLVISQYLSSLPFILLAVALGHRLNRIVRRHRFDRYVYLMLLLVGMSLLANELLIVVSP